MAKKDVLLNAAEYAELGAIMDLFSLYGISLTQAARGTFIPFSRLSAASSRISAEGQGETVERPLSFSPQDLTQLRGYVQALGTTISRLPQAPTEVATPAAPEPVAEAPVALAPELPEPVAAEEVVTSAAPEPVAEAPQQPETPAPEPVKSKAGRPKAAVTVSKAKTPSAKSKAKPTLTVVAVAPKTPPKAIGKTTGGKKVVAPDLRPDFLKENDITDARYITIKERLVVLTHKGVVHKVLIDSLSSEFELPKPVLRKILRSDYNADSVRGLKELLAEANR
jgi:hypothetical protein